MMRALLNRLVWWLPPFVIGLHLFLFFLALERHSYFSDDSFPYLTLARNMGQHGVFSQSVELPLTHDVQRTPGYPFFLLLTGESPFVILLLQHLMIFICGYFVFRILKNLTHGRAAAAGAWLFLLMPYPAVFASLILSEALFLFLLLASLWLLSRYLSQGRRVTDVVLTAMVLALAVYVRPVAMPLILLLVPVTVWAARGMTAFSFVLRTVLPLFFWAGMILPWYLRNHQVTGRFVFSTMGDMALVQGRAGGMLAMTQGMPGDDHTLFMLADSLVARETGLAGIRTYYAVEQRHETEMLSPAAVRVAQRYILSHPLDFAMFTARSLGQMFTGVCYGWSHQVTGHRGIALFLAAISACLSVFIYLSVLASLFRWRRWQALQWFAFVSLALMLLISAAAWADGRYRFPCDALALIVALPALGRGGLSPSDSNSN